MIRENKKSDLSSAFQTATQAMNVGRPKPLSGFLASFLAGLSITSPLACRVGSSNEGESAVKVVNGHSLAQNDKSGSASAFQISILDETLVEVEKSCTAVAVSEKAVLIAAHCIPAGASAEARLKIEGKTASVKTIVGPESLRGAVTLSERDTAMDLAALVFEGEAAIFEAREIAILADRSALLGTPIKLIGYGATNIEALKVGGPTRATGLASQGTQIVRSASGSTYGIHASERDLKTASSGVSIAGPGDSGGPVFDSQNHLLGILVGLSFDRTGVAVSLDGDPTKVESDVDLADGFGNSIVDLTSPYAQRILGIAMGQESGAIAYNAEKNGDYLAICNRNGDGGGGGGGGGGSSTGGSRRGRIGDLLRNRQGGNRGNTSTGSGEAPPLSRTEINDILDSL
jgi:hypothetical protein